MPDVEQFWLVEQLDFNTGSAGFIGNGNSIVIENFATTDMNTQRWQAGHIGKHGGGQYGLGIDTVEIFITQ